MFTKTLSLAIAFPCVVLAAAANAQTYECEFKDGHRRNVIPPQVIVQVAADGASAQVIDSLGHYHKIAPVPATFVKDTTQRLRVRWTLKDLISSAGQKATLNFSLTYQKAKGKAFVNMDIPGYGNTETGSGSCAIAK